MTIIFIFKHCINQGALDSDPVELWTLLLAVVWEKREQHVCGGDFEEHLPYRLRIIRHDSFFQRLHLLYIHLKRRFLQFDLF